VTAVPDPAPHAAAVKGQRELSGVENLRELRLALDVIGMFYPENARSDAVNAALDDINDHLCAEEDLALRESGVLDRYLIIRPVNPLNPPPQEDIQRISAAVRTLAQLGMLAGRGDDR
jgi:hypothetical protein